MDVALGCLLAANAWPTGRWTAQKKQWIWPWGSFCLRWKSIRSHWSGLGMPVGCECLANGTLDRPQTAMDLALGSFCLRWKPIRMPGERHAGPPRNSNGSGLGVAFACAGSPQEAIDVALGCPLAANAWRMARWTAQKQQWIWPWGSFCVRWKPIRSHWSGLLRVLGVWSVLGLANGKLGRP